MADAASAAPKEGGDQSKARAGPLKEPVLDEMSSDSILEVLLVNATRTLSLLRDEEGIPLRRIGRADVERALEMLGLPTDFVTAAGDLIQQRFRNCDLTHRQLASFLRFGRAPGNSLNLPPGTRTLAPRRTRALHQSILAVYERAGQNGKAPLPPCDVRKPVQSSLPARERQVFGADAEGPTLGEEAQLVMSSFQTQWREGKAKMTDLISQLDRDGDGELQHAELRKALLAVAADGSEEGAEPSEEAIEQVLSVFDRDGSGSIDAHELKRALCGNFQLLGRKMRTGGAGQFDVWATNNRALRHNVEAVSSIGKRLLDASGSLPDGEELQEELRELLVRHSGRFVELYEGQGNIILSKPAFVAVISTLFGLQAADVGTAAAHALQAAVAEIFAGWDLAGLGLSPTEVNKILHKGGRVNVAQHAKADAIFQTELRVKPAASTSPRHRGRKDRETLMSEARQALHGFVIESRAEQLRKRAQRVAPVQLESLLHTMSASADSILDLFLKWDADGDGTVGPTEFAAAVARLGFRFSKEVCDELFAFFDKDDSSAVSLDEIEMTLKWGKARKQQVRPLLAGWRQLSLTIDANIPLHEQMRIKLSEQGKNPRDMFKSWDDSGDGSLDKEEMGELMKTLGGMELSNIELDKLFESFDHDASGTISWKELSSSLRKEVPVEQLMNALADPGIDSKLWDLFQNKWDADGDGLLDVDEFGHVLQELGVQLTVEGALEDLFNMLDEDGSGSISLRELQNSLRWVRSCEKCMALRNEAFTFDGTLSIQTQIRRALAVNSVRVMDLFREFDDSGDGLLSVREFERAMPLIGIHADRSEIQQLFLDLDADHDGWVTFKEFNRQLRKENDAIAKDYLNDPFGREVQSNWRPPSPAVAVIDLGKLRENVKVEHHLRGLDSVQLKTETSSKPIVVEGDADEGPV